MFFWRVEPLCEKQLLDVDPKDVLNSGLFRKCDVYKSGGGYDRFPAICKKRLGFDYKNQFVVQLHGCNLKCWYCYVTPDGVNSDKFELLTDYELMDYFKQSGQDIFHLMGGSPAIYLEHWGDLIGLMPKDKVFHSDFTLVEKFYEVSWLNKINQKNTLYAVNIKGVSYKDFLSNTRVNFSEAVLRRMFYDNLDELVACNVNFYITFTNPDKDELDRFKDVLVKRYGDSILNDSFVIDIVHYDAIKSINSPEEAKFTANIIKNR